MDTSYNIIRLQNMVFYGYHGGQQPERELGQRFEVDVDIFYDATEAIRTDDVNRAVDYRQVFELVEEIVTGKEYHLLETLAQNIAESILDWFSIDGLLVRVRKPNVPLRGNLDFVEVEIVRKKG